METLAIIIRGKFEKVIKVFDDTADFVADAGFVANCAGEGVLGTGWGGLVGQEKATMNRVDYLEEVAKVKGSRENRVGSGEAAKESSTNTGKAT